MKFSKYNICVEYNNNWLIYNLLKSTCIILDRNEYERFLSFTPFDGSETLYDLNIYVDDEYDELNEVFYYIRRNSDIYNQEYRKHRIYTTFKCNAKCSYCFQHNSGTDSMNLSVAAAIIERIIKQQGKANNLTITWFGGEPLLNTDIIDYISQELKVRLPKEVNYSSFMITNGILFDEHIVKKAVNLWNLESVQITLDGMKNTYESIKKFNIKDAFEKVISNIHLLLAAEIKVRIRLNYCEQNFKDILNLIDFIGQEFSDKTFLFVYAHKIFDDKNLDNSKFASVEDDIAVWDRLYANGLCENVLDGIKSNMISCTAGSLYNEMYLPNGDIGKCAQGIADGSIIGDIYAGIKNSKVAKWNCGLLPSNCMECKLLPVCGGGCIYERMKNKNGCTTSEGIIRHKLLHYLKQYIDNNGVST